MYQKSNRYQVFFNIELFRDHKRIPDEILAHKYVPILWFIIFFDKFATFNPNKTVNLALYVMNVLGKIKQIVKKLNPFLSLP